MSEDYGADSRLGRVEMQLSVHEAVCAERYKSILDAAAETKAQFSNIYKLMVNIGGLILCGMAGILVRLVFFGG